MHYRHLGKSPLRISTLCLGTMMFADQTDLAEARRITDHAHAQGVNFIDTADVYSTGQSEVMVGQLIQARRHDWVLATKLGNKMSGRPNESHYSRAWVQRACEAACNAWPPTTSTSTTCTATTSAWIWKSRCAPSMH